MEKNKRLTTKRKAMQADGLQRKIPFWPACWRIGLPLMAVVLFCAITVNARSLNDQVNFLLTGSCDELLASGGTPVGDLAAICGPGGIAGDSSSGGAAGAPQTAPGIVQERLATARGEEPEEMSSGTGSELMPGLNIFLSGGYESLDRDITTFEDGYDSDIKRVTAGGDYQFTDKFLAGAVLDYYNQDGDLDGGGDFDNDSYGLTLYASVLPTDQVFVQMTAGYAAKDYERSRGITFDRESDSNPEITGLVTGDYDGDEFSVGILTGYDFTAGNLSIGPRLGVDYIRTNIDSYSETGTTGLELTFDDADETSLQSRLGLAASLALSTGFGVLMPQASVDWVHEFDDDQRSESFSFVDDSSSVAFLYENEDPDRDFFELGVGLSAVLPKGWLPFAQFLAIFGHDYLDSAKGIIGLRKEF